MLHRSQAKVTFLLPTLRALREFCLFDSWMPVYRLSQASMICQYEQTIDAGTKQHPSFQ